MNALSRKTLLLLGLATVALTALPNTAHAQTTTIFDFTGANQSFEVPTGVTSLSVSLWGAGGGRSGGSGAFVSGLLTVTPGETLTLIVGGGGGFTTSSTGNAFGGGGEGRGSVGVFTINSGGGGGRSGIRNSGNTEVVTAGAGGGGGNSTNGAAGGLAVGNSSTGGGGTQSAGGAGADPGSAFQGGNATGLAGGGGGGYFGGGAGTAFGGGGGGSSLMTALTGFVGEAGSNGNNSGTAVLPVALATRTTLRGSERVARQPRRVATGGL